MASAGYRMAFITRQRGAWIVDPGWDDLDNFGYEEIEDIAPIRLGAKTLAEAKTEAARIWGAWREQPVDKRPQGYFVLAPNPREWDIGCIRADTPPVIDGLSAGRPVRFKASSSIAKQLGISPRMIGVIHSIVDCDGETRANVQIRAIRKTAQLIPAGDLEIVT